MRKRPMANAPRFYVGDKVCHKFITAPGSRFLEVIGVGKEINYPGLGLVRRIYWRVGPELSGEEGWTWDFSLEEW
jgi:hypothetical protein